MVKRVMLSLLVAVSAVASAEVVADDLKTADDVIAKYIEAVGGRKAMQSTKTRRASGKNTMGPGMEMARARTCSHIPTSPPRGKEPLPNTG